MSRTTVQLGGSVVVSGAGCAPDAEVGVFIDGREVGSVTANGEGMFSSSVTPLGPGVGQETITAICGSKRFAAVVSLVATSAISAPAGDAAVFGLFVLLGAVLLRGQFGGAANRRRRRRRGASEILESQ